MKKKPSLKRLGELRRRVEPLSREIKLERSLFESLAGSICSQQLSLKAAATIFGRFKDLFPESIPTPEKLLTLSITTLRGAGLSEAKARAVLDLAEKTISGVVPTDEVAMQLSDAELVERLTEVRGIGRWTVEMILMFRYRRPDVWPNDDLGVQKGFRLLFPELKFKNAKELKPLGDFWKGKRSEIAWYCWRALEEQEAQTLTMVPLTWQKQKFQLWLKGGALWRLEFGSSSKKPKVTWPGEVKISKSQSAKWQKMLEQSLKKGVPPELLNIMGSELQQQVWAAIAVIPWGKTRTYQEIADSIGKPKAVRACASACGANPLPLFIPCHRVVGMKGIGGYAGGAKLKLKLLAAEK